MPSKTITPKIEIPKENINLESLGLTNQNLFYVDGELAQRYNAILKRAFDLDCDVDSFRIDKRGLSPELCTYFKEKYPERFEFGDSYLNMRSANRFMVIVSPDQKSAPLVAPQTSYDDGVIDEVYKRARHTIEDITQSEALFGELEEGINFFHSANDLLPLRTIEVNMDTLENTIKDFFELKKMSDNLGDGNNALDDNYISQMQSYVNKIGDIRTRSISKVFPITKEVHCFYVEFFKGIHCLRNFKNKSRDPTKTIFVSHHQEIENYGDEIMSLDLHDKTLPDVLHRYGFLKYNEKLLDQRLNEIEDEILLSEGIDVVSLSNYDRKRTLISNAKKLNRKDYIELREIRKYLSANQNLKFKDVLVDASYESMIKLSEPAGKPEIINHMLAEIDPTDVFRLYNDNKRKLITEFPSMPLNRQRYIANALLNNTGGYK